MTKPNILFIDIETTPNLAWTWGYYETDVLEVVKEWEILSVACKYLTLKPIAFAGQDKFSEEEIVKFIWKQLDQADVVIAHNGDRFDIRKINAKFLKYGLTPPSPYKTVDTRTVAKRYFALNSNKLDYIGKYLNLGQKIHHEGMPLWFDCMEGKAEAWKTMRTYNVNDITLLEKIYLKLRPWIKNHPNLADYDTAVVCPKCGEADDITSKGTRQSGILVKQRYVCKSCGGWFQTTKGKVKPVQNL